MRVGIGRVIGARRRRAQDGQSGRGPEPHALERAQFGLRVPPVRRRGVEVDLVGGPAEARGMQRFDHPMPGVRVRIDQAGHHCVPRYVEDLPRL
ncbi:MAG: hypothetical protein ACRDGM_09770, partial [bacterium]